jgi:hypothetical protein
LQNWYGERIGGGYLVGLVWLVWYTGTYVMIGVGKSCSLVLTRDEVFMIDDNLIHHNTFQIDWTFQRFGVGGIDVDTFLVCSILYV